MNTTFEYKGYIGSAEVDVDDHVLVGRLLFIRDVITYSATDVSGLEAAFREAVDDYLLTCEQEGTPPEVPCKGSFNVRVGPARHRVLALTAKRQGVGLNDFVVNAIDAAIANDQPKALLHKHEVTVSFVGKQVEMTASTGRDPHWKTINELPA